MIRNRVCELFGIRYPVIEGGMLRVSCPELAAAISNAGGLGMLSGAKSSEELRYDIQKTRELTDRPFGVNLPIVFLKERFLEMAEVVAQAGVKVAVTTAGTSAHTKRLKDGGLIVMHVVPTVGHALKAEANNVDAVVAEGVESGGFLSYDEVTTMALVPQVVDAVKVPVIAAGGIGDARGFVAALALGAEGIQMGTRFIATKECPVPTEYKQAILKATDNSSEVAGRGKSPHRLFKADFLKEVLPAYTASYSAGQVAGLVRDIPTVAELIEEMMHTASLVSNRVREALSGPA